ncbi:probable carboxylesterase 2 [Juglans microcarpa x Juglans regia]|uniref:probable carboxylesterase 2 n=1 Tax=Juglans microcarpa x Juglans regia TaxID=2249226 RepID=UPI001B7F18F7|nr:probable carboxylesterase 2 [Juglans microcarpa x Juglans regia]
MDSGSTSEVALEFLPYFRAYKDGRVERFFGTDVVPPSIDSHSGTATKDVQIVQETGLAARIFIPGTIDPGQKLPVLVYYHGGSFYMGSPFCATYHNHLASLVVEANIVAVSVSYRLAPEHPVPIGYEDSWVALQWVASHFAGEGSEAWLRDHVDFQRVFLAGDSMGGNIVHNMAARAGVEGLPGVRLLGICLVHPYFARKETVGTCVADRSWLFTCPTTSGFDDPRINPAEDSRLSRLGCSRVLIFITEKDETRDRGLFYYETLRTSGWGGVVEIVEAEGEEHVFHLFRPNCEKALALLKKLSSFINQDNA